MLVKAITPISSCYEGELVNQIITDDHRRQASTKSDNTGGAFSLRGLGAIYKLVVITLWQLTLAIISLIKYLPRQIQTHVRFHWWGLSISTRIINHLYRKIQKTINQTYYFYHYLINLSSIFLNPVVTNVYIFFSKRNLRK